MLVIVGTTNPTKLAGVEEAFKEVFTNLRIEVKGIRVSNRVGTQPIGLDSIFVGAKVRALNAMRIAKGDFYVGIEAGLLNIGGLWLDIHIAAVTDGKTWGLGASPAFQPPPRIVDETLERETELDAVVDAMFGTRDIGSCGGVIKILTNGLIDRKDLVKQAVLMALIPWIKPEFYSK